MAAVEFGVLGSIEARVDGHPVELGHTRQRLLLAALLMDANHEVPIDALAERIWGEEQARRGTLYGYLSRLRRALAAAEGVEIAHRPAGYVLTADPQAVDLYRFRELVGQARAVGDDRRAAELFGQALDLWRGQALAGADTPWAEAARRKLHQERLAAELDQAEVRLRLGHHAELLAGLQTLAEESPLDERLAGQLIVALYRCGRTAEALGHYQRTHRTLISELGIEPGPELRQLHQQILTGDLALTLETEAAAATAPAPAVMVPRQLPAPPALFTGRENDLDCLSAALEEPGERGEAGGTVVISAIGGTGGIGKTYLALRWAHQHLGRFPDGQLYVNLRGFDPAAEPVAPSAAVRDFLEALGVEPAAIPAGADAQLGLYRSLIVGRRMLVVLDNARDAAQVVPLLPGSPSCTVLVTSRNQLTSLVTSHAARPLALDALPEADARALLARHLGEERLAAEPEATAALLKHCAGLPLALSITAARATVQPGLPLVHLAEELAETTTRLDALDTGELSASLRAVFATSYRTLDDTAARAFDLLGLASGPDISLPAAAALIRQSTARTRVLLRALEAAHLVQQHVPGRYRMHDLVGLYAAEHSRVLDRRERDATLRRLVDFYLHTAHHAGLLVEPQPLLPLAPDPPAPGCAPHQPADRQAALAWYEAERPCLFAVQRLAADLGWHTLAWRLPHALFVSPRHRGGFRDAVDMWQVALEAAEKFPDPRPKAIAHSYLGYFLAPHYPRRAMDHLDQALPVFEEAEDLPGLALTHFNLCCALVWAPRGRDLRRGLHHAERASELYHSLGNPGGESYSLSMAGWCHAGLDQYQQARARCEQALAIPRPLGSPGPEAFALDRLGFALHRSGHYAEALACHHQAVSLFRDDLGMAFWEATSLTQLGHTHRALGQIAEARHAWQHAHDIFRARHHTAEADRVQRWLDSLGDAPAGG